MKNTSERIEKYNRRTLQFLPLVLKSGAHLCERVENKSDVEASSICVSNVTLSQM
uniref:Uncharacterized protein n=1 Tax=Solanum lycopersicum TaxID=4081 RepID=A0A3Q7GHD2_SOLLC